MNFRTTLWSRIEALGEGRASEGGFVSRYRAPLLAFLRRRGLSPEDAEDVAQEVFLRLFDRELLAQADRSRGRFRSYLLGITKRVLLQQREREGALKRGGDRARVPFEDAPEPVAPPDPTFDACWVEGLLEEALERLAGEHPLQHQVLRLRLREGLSLAEVGERIGRSAAQVKSDHHRAKQRLARLIKDSVRAYCSSQEEYEDELLAFREALG